MLFIISRNHLTMEIFNPTTARCPWRPATQAEIVRYPVRGSLYCNPIEAKGVFYKLPPLHHQSPRLYHGGPLSLT